MLISFQKSYILCFKQCLIGCINRYSNYVLEIGQISNFEKKIDFSTFFFLLAPVRNHAALRPLRILQFSKKIWIPDKITYKGGVPFTEIGEIASPKSGSKSTKKWSQSETCDLLSCRYQGYWVEEERCRKVSPFGIIGDTRLLKRAIEWLL